MTCKVLVAVDRELILSVVDLLREEQGTTGRLARRALARMLGLQRPIPEEIREHALAVMRGAGIEPAGPMERLTDDARAELRAAIEYYAEPLQEFVDDAELWEPEGEPAGRTS